MSRPLPREFGRYRIDNLLGVDPFGSLYIAHDASHERSVLLRVLDGQAAADSDVRARFDRATRLAIAVYHDRLALVYEAGEAEGTLFVAVKVPDGVPASDWLRDRGPLSPVRVAYIIEQIAEVLDAIHEKWIALGCVNARLVWIGANDIVTVTGLGMALGEVTPERDRRDLAALAYQLLTGRAYHPARPGEPEKDRAKGGTHYAEPSPVVRAMLDKATALEGSPFATAGALAAALRAAVESAPSGPAGRRREPDFHVHARELVEKAGLAARAGDWAQASRLAEEALTLEPKNHDALRLRERARRVAESQARSTEEKARPVPRVRKSRLRPFASGRLWLVLIPIAVVLVMVGAWLAWRETLAKLASVGPAAVVTRTITGSGGAAPSTSTRTPVPTRTSTVRPIVPTATPAAPSATPVPPSASPSASATRPTATASPSATPSPSPTAEATAARRSLPAPQPYSPNDGEVFRGASEEVVLAWTDVGPLAADEYYVVRIPHERGEEVGITKGTSWRVPAYVFWLRPATGRLQWSVAVRIRTSETIPGTALAWPAVSPESAWRSFVLQPGVTSTPPASATAEPTAEPTAEATPEPTAEATPEPTAESTVEATAEATVEATSEATAGQAGAGTRR